MSTIASFPIQAKDSSLTETAPTKIGLTCLIDSVVCSNPHIPVQLYIAIILSLKDALTSPPESSGHQMPDLLCFCEFISSFQSDLHYP